MPRFFVARREIRGGKAILTGQELEHLRKVLRLRPGARVTLFDDEGWEHEGVLESYKGEVGEIDIVKSYQPGRESTLDITLAQALGKGDKMDLVVEKATELGVRRIVPFVATYTVPKLEAGKMELRQRRWKRIAVSAAKQSGRTRIPEVLEMTDFGHLVERPWGYDLKLLFWERESAQGLAQVREGRVRVGSVLLAIGPEGGFSPEEASEAMRYGFQSVRLGKRILRTETAALAAVTLVQFLWGDMG